MNAKLSLASQLAPSRIESSRPLLLAGLQERFTNDTMKNLPALWQRFAPYIGKVPHQVSRVCYGLLYNMVPQPFSVDYMAAVEASSTSGLPEGFSHVSIPALRYAIFPHREHVSSISKTIDAIYRQWFPNSGYAPAKAPGANFTLERYGEHFDPQSATGDIEVWVPIEA